MDGKRRLKARNVAYAAVIAACYTVLTVGLAPISYGPVQCRVSEALCVLPYFTVSAVPGLFIGCLLSNALVGAPIYDVVFGSLATLLAALATRAMRARCSKYLAPLPAVAVNGLMIGAVLKYAYGVPVPLWTACAYVAVGQVVACFGLGIPLLLVTERFRKQIFGDDR